METLDDICNGWEKKVRHYKLKLSKAEKATLMEISAQASRRISLFLIEIAARQKS